MRFSRVCGDISCTLQYLSKIAQLIFHFRFAVFIAVPHVVDKYSISK